MWTTWMPFGLNNEGIQADYAVTKDRHFRMYLLASVCGVKLFEGELKNL